MRSWKAAALAILFGILAPVTVLAHAKMTTTVPTDGATVAAGLSEVQLSFSKPMRLTVVKIVRGADKQDVPAKGHLPKTFVKSATVGVDPLSAGLYEVSWTAVADDGHVMNGGFKFTVREAKDAQPTQ